MHVPLLDLKAQYASLRADMRDAVNAVLESQYFIGGTAVSELEEQVSAYCDARHGIGVSSGTDALLCALMALDIKPGDEVITTPYTFFATAGSIWRAGAKPVFVDICPATFNLDPGRIETALTERTRAILPVHLFGQMADMDPIMAIAERHGLAVVEDACQAIGATYKGRCAGSIGRAGCFSFFPSKNLGGLGDGGMIVTQDSAFADRLRSLRNHGGTHTYYHKWVGGNFRLDAIQAAGLLVKLKHLDDWSEQRRRNAASYDRRFVHCPQVTTPTIAPHNMAIFNQYVIRVPRRDQLRAFLTERDVGSNVYYPLSLHLQECFADLGYRHGDFPESERASAETLALPIYPELSDEQITYVADCIIEFFA